MAMIDLRFPRRQVTNVEEERRGSFSIAPTADEQEESQEGSSPRHNQNRFVFWYNYVTVLLWRMGELHMSKIVSLTLICVVLSQVSTPSCHFMLSNGVQHLAFAS